MNVVGYMLVMRVHEFDDDKCDVWPSCVVVIFMKMGQKRRNLILMILNELLC